jgi:hypothetical protein
MKRDFLDPDRNVKALCRVSGFFGGGFVGYRLALAEARLATYFYGDGVTWLAGFQGIVVGGLLGLIVGQIFYFVYRRLRG